LGSGAGDSYVCYNSTSKIMSYGSSVCDGPSEASPFVISLDGVPLSEILANQWKIEARSVNRLEGYDGTTDPAFVLGSFKDKETDYIDLMEMHLRCEVDQVVQLKKYPLTFIGKLDQTVADDWLASAVAQDKIYFQSREGDRVIVAFASPQPLDYADCDSYDFVFVAYGYYEWEEPEFDQDRIVSFWEKYAQYRFDPIQLIGEVFFRVADWLVNLFDRSVATRLVSSSPPVIESLTVSESQIVAGDLLELNATVTDADTNLDDLTYRWNVNPGLGQISGTKSLVHWGVSSLAETTDVIFTVSVSDGNNVAKKSVIVTVIVPGTPAEEITEDEETVEAETIAEEELEEDPGLAEEIIGESPAGESIEDQPPAEAVQEESEEIPELASNDEAVISSTADAL
jgi:hypothetical protein